MHPRTKQRTCTDPLTRQSNPEETRAAGGALAQAMHARRWPPFEGALILRTRCNIRSQAPGAAHTGYLTRGSGGHDPPQAGEGVRVLRKFRTIRRRPSGYLAEIGISSE